MAVGERSSGGDNDGNLPLDPATLPIAKPGFFIRFIVACITLRGLPFSIRC